MTTVVAAIAIAPDTSASGSKTEADRAPVVKSRQVMGAVHTVITATGDMATTTFPATGSDVCLHITTTGA